MFTGVSPLDPVSPDLHFISKYEKNKTLKVAIKMKGGGGSVELSDPLKVVEHKSVRMHHLASLLSKFLFKSKYRIKVCHIARV